jgi:ATP-dependent DNA ligase
MLAYKDNERVRLISRNGRDHTRRFRDIAGAISKLSARSLVLDGKVAIYDEQLVRGHSRTQREARSRRDVWLGLAAILTPWLFAAVVTIIRWPR